MARAAQRVFDRLMHNQPHCFTHDIIASHLRRVLGLLALGGLLSGALHTVDSLADDDYVRSIRSEAQKVEQLDQRPSTTDVQTENRVKEFESALLLDSPNNFRLYQQLTPEKRLNVFQFYSKGRDIQAVQRRIIELRLGN